MSIESTLSPSEPEVHYGEDFVPIEDPRSSLSNSIVKKELLDQEAEEEQKDSDYVVSGGNAARDDGETSLETTKVELPEKLAKSVVILTCESTGRGGSCNVYLIGTIHDCLKSCREVEELVSILKPEVVFLELCSSRRSQLYPPKVPTMSDMIESWKQKENIFGILYGWFDAKIASQQHSEFRVAYEEALKYGGIMILGDRPIHITLKRTWAKISLWHLVRFLFFSPSVEVTKTKSCQLEEIDNEDMATLIQETSKEFPSLVDVLVNERDQYMASLLLRIASEYSSVVAVVGKGHISGIKKNWKQPITMIDMMEIPSNESMFTVKRIISALAMAVVGIVLGILLVRRW